MKRTLALLLALACAFSLTYYRIPLTLRNTGSYEIDWYHDTDFCVNGWQTYAFIDVDSRSVISGGMDLITFQIDKDGLSQVVTPGELKGALQYYVDDDSSYVGRTVPIELTTSAGAGENKPFDVQELVWSEDDLSLYLTGMRSSSYDLVFSFYLDNQSGDGCYFDVNEDSISLNGSGEDELVI